MIKIGLRFVELSSDHLQYAAQIGVDGGTLRTDDLPGVAETGHVDTAGLRQLLQRLDSLNLQLAGMELQRARITNVLRGAPEGAREIDDLCETIRVLGGEGAPLVTCGFSVAHADEHIQPWRGYQDLPGGRAGTDLRTFDAAWVEDSDLVTWGIDTGDPAVRVPEAEVWRRMDGFMERVVPAAESAGVRLAFHPNDPPMPLYRGVEQPFVHGPRG